MSKTNKRTSPEEKAQIVSEIVAMFGGNTIVNRKQLLEYEEHKFGAPTETHRSYIRELAWICNDKSIRVGRGVYDLSSFLTTGVTSVSTSEGTSETTSAATSSGE